MNKAVAIPRKGAERLAAIDAQERAVMNAVRHYFTAAKKSVSGSLTDQAALRADLARDEAWIDLLETLEAQLPFEDELLELIDAAKSDCPRYAAQRAADCCTFRTSKYLRGRANNAEFCCNVCGGTWEGDVS